MKVIAAVIISSACFFQGRSERFDYHSRVGVVDAKDESKLCLIIPNASLGEGSLVNLITPSNQAHARATIKQKTTADCSSTDTPGDASFYLVELVETDKRFKIRAQGPAIALISSGTVSGSNGKASADLDEDGQKEFFRVCTSNEGLHLTIWSGKPLSGQRRWHFYYYLGFDVVPSCTKKDYQ